jgi:hypothetical protein
MVREAEAAKDADEELRRMIEYQCGGVTNGTNAPIPLPPATAWGAYLHTTAFGGTRIMASQQSAQNREVATALGSVRSVSKQIEDRRQTKVQPLPPLAFVLV